MIKISVTGVKEIDACLKAMPAALTHKVLGTAHADAAKPLVQREKSLAPVGSTHNLVDSIGVVKSSIARAGSLGEVRVGPRKRGRYKGFAAHLIEYGTRPRRTKKGANRGFLRPEPFAEPAFNQTKGVVQAGIVTSIGKVLVRTMKRTLTRK
jgi:HK97 gp10 family phage protein